MASPRSQRNVGNYEMDESNMAVFRRATIF